MPPGGCGGGSGQLLVTRSHVELVVRVGPAPRLPGVSSDGRVAVGVIGTGAITKEHLAYLTTSPRTRLIAVADLSAAAARYTAERWGAPRWYTSHQALLGAGDVDVVHVLTPPTTHTRIATDALRAGAHVICEKPLAPTRDELAALHELAVAHGRWLLEDQNYRWNDPVLALQEVVSSGRLGAIRDVDVRLALRIRDGGAFADRHVRSAAHDLPAGPVHDLLPHMAYLALLFLPEAARPERASVHWSNQGGDDGMWRTDDLDATLIAGGAHLRLRFSATTRPEGFSLVVRGESGEAATDVFQPHLTVRTPRAVGKELTPIVDHVANGVRLARYGVRNLTQRLMQHSTYHGLHRFLDLTYEALQTGGEPPLSYRDMDDAARLVDLLLREEHQR